MGTSSTARKARGSSAANSSTSPSPASRALATSPSTVTSSPTCAAASRQGTTRGAAAQRLAVEGRHRRLRLLVGRHLDEREAARTPRLTIGHDPDLLDLTTVLLEERPKLAFLALIREVPDEQPFPHSSSPGAATRRRRNGGLLACRPCGGLGSGARPGQCRRGAARRAARRESRAAVASAASQAVAPTASLSARRLGAWTTASVAAANAVRCVPAQSYSNTAYIG